MDVYSLGNVFYLLLMNVYPFHGISQKKAKHLVMDKKRPVIYTDIWKSEDPIIKVLLEAMST